MFGFNSFIGQIVRRLVFSSSEQSFRLEMKACAYDLLDPRESILYVHDRWKLTGATLDVLSCPQHLDILEGSEGRGNITVIF
jgi:hypothetical protein